jgi:flavin-dependent dehydrogenase
MKNIFISGDGVAACCCAYLLRQAGAKVAVSRRDRPRVPAILLSESAVRLIEGVFGELSFGEPHRIRRRMVAWGPDAQAIAVDHSAWVVSEQSLLAALWSRVDVDEEGEADWTIFTSRPLPAGASDQRFGSRTASVVQVRLAEGTDASSCWIESLDQGWLFLIPNAARSALVLGVGDSAGSLLRQSRIIAGEIAEQGEPAGEFPAHPRILSSLCGDQWLACGTAAMAFDPLCGDGTSHAIREAILAAAIIQAAAGGENPEELRSHYETRLLAGFGRHLALCSQFYRTGNRGPWWDQELTSLDEGMAWCRERLGNRRGFQYQLNGFELQPTGEKISARYEP